MIKITPPCKLFFSGILSQQWKADWQRYLEATTEERHNKASQQAVTGRITRPKGAAFLIWSIWLLPHHPNTPCTNDLHTGFDTALVNQHSRRVPVVLNLSIHGVVHFSKRAQSFCTSDGYTWPKKLKIKIFQRSRIKLYSSTLLQNKYNLFLLNRRVIRSHK